MVQAEWFKPYGFPGENDRFDVHEPDFIMRAGWLDFSPVSI
jgi:hypothetical protein